MHNFRLLLLLSILLSFSSTKSDFQNVPYTHVGMLNNAIQMNATSFDTGDMLIIYTYLECKPCLVLAKRLSRVMEKDKISPSKVAYLNVLNSDTSRVKSYLRQSGLRSPYFILPYPPNLEGSYPKISAYDNTGTLDWTITGLSKSNMEKMTDYIED